MAKVGPTLASGARSCAAGRYARRPSKPAWRPGSKRRTRGVAAAQRLLVHGRLGKLSAGPPLIPAATRRRHGQRLHPWPCGAAAAGDGTARPAGRILGCRAQLRRSRTAPELPLLPLLQEGGAAAPAGQPVLQAGLGSSPHEGQGLGGHQVHVLDGPPLAKVVENELAHLRAAAAEAQRGSRPTQQCGRQGRPRAAAPADGGAPPAGGCHVNHKTAPQCTQ